MRASGQSVGQRTTAAGPLATVWSPEVALNGGSTSVCAPEKEIETLIKSYFTITDIKVRQI